MRSSFLGLETARRGLFTQQSALYTTGHNVANANTPGYSRQRVNFQQTNAYPSIGVNSPALPGQLGTGVEGGTVQRIRESFLDVQYRTENNKVGYYGALAQSLQKMEGIMNEPSESGLQSALDQFWNALQDLTTQTENSGARDVVAARGQMVAETINYYYNTLTQVQTDIGHQVNVKVLEINALIEKIDHLNRSIADVEPHGYIPNDLYDERDRLVDELSGLINIKVSKVKPDIYGKAETAAEGLYHIELVRKDGSSYTPPINLVTVTEEGMGEINKLSLQYGQGDLPLVESVKVGAGEEGNGGIEIKDLTSLSGELSGLIESYGYIADKENESNGAGNSEIKKGIFPEMIEKLNIMTEAFVHEFNLIHKQGFDLKGESGKDFFEIVDGLSPAAGIKVSDDILQDSDNIAAASAEGGVASGNNENAHRLADIIKKSFENYEIYKQSDVEKPDELQGSLFSFFSGMIGELGVRSQSAQKDLKNSITLAESVEMNRQSVSSVSLDEEMTNMIKFQQAYNASARMITVMDEILDRVVNGVGLGGR